MRKVDGVVDAGGVNNMPSFLSGIHYSLVGGGSWTQNGEASLSSSSGSYGTRTLLYRMIKDPVKGLC
mgnify:FL=1